MRVFAPLVVVCALVVGVAATLQNRVLSGSVVDPAGSAVPGVTLELRRGTSVEQRTVSDRGGAWRFEKVTPGAYEIRASLSGFATSVVPVTVSDKDVVALRIPLKAGAMAEMVTVAPPATTVQAGIARATAAPPAPPPAGVPFAGDALASRYLHEVARRETASYAEIHENRFRSVADHPLSTFSADVDTASYANVRRFLNEGRLPPADAVRIEEMINYFKYEYAAPRNGARIGVTTELAVTPWNPKTRLALIGVRAKPTDQAHTPPRNLTFLIDVSGSMAPPNRLALVKTAMQMLVDTLRPEDTVAIVVYAGNSGVVLKSTSGDRKAEIQRAIGGLHAAGSTNGGAGIQQAYELAAENFVKGGINRVILATDGDFNVGVTNRAELTKLIEDKRERGIFLSVLGVGGNNLQDATMEMLADKGNGNYSYLDSIQEARRVLIAEAGSTLVTVAKDVKLQVEFNPRFVSAYRLVGYENRVMRKEDFNNDRKDAGEVGAGHSVTALYEIVPVGESVPGASVDPLKYQAAAQPARTTASANTSELMTVKVRYKAPQGANGAGAFDDASKVLEFPVKNVTPRMTANVGFAAAVAQFGMLLRKSDFAGAATWQSALALAREHRGSDPDGYRAEFVRLIDIAAALNVRRETSPELRR